MTCRTIHRSQTFKHWWTDLKTEIQLLSYTLYTTILYVSSQEGGGQRTYTYFFIILLFQLLNIRLTLSPHVGAWNALSGWEFCILLVWYRFNHQIVIVGSWLMLLLISSLLQDILFVLPSLPKYVLQTIMNDK